VGWTTSANLTSGSGCSTSSEYFSSNFSESLTTNSTWSQSGGGPAIGANMAIYSRNSVYSGGSGGGYGGYGGSSSYSGGQNWTWSDPNLSTYDAHALSEIRITPNGPAEIGPVMFRSAPNVAAVMPPSLVEDAEAATVEKGEESAIGRFLWGLVPGSSLVGAYRDYQKGSYVNAALNGLFGLADLATVGSLVKVRSSLKLLVGFMKVRVKDALVDEAANQAGVAVAERLGPEAGFVTQIIVSATLSKNVSQQNKTQLGFAADAKKITRSNAPSNVDLLSPKAKRHILYGDGPNSGGHLWPGQPGKGPFPKSWDTDKIVHEVSDIITDPKSKWYAQTGKGGLFTKSGKPARWVSWEVRDGVRIRTVYEPGIGEVVTAFPDPYAPITGIPIP
jgi:hypothetical protein